MVPLSATGLFLGQNLSWELFSVRHVQGILRFIFLILLVGGLVQTSFRFALKRRNRWDEFALLVVLVCGVNFSVQLSGGIRSGWQALYLFLVGLAALAFPNRLIVSLVGVIVTLETSNWILHMTGDGSDLLRLILLVVASAVVFGFMQRAERHQVERVEEELHRLNLGLQELTQSEGDDRMSPLSEEGKRIGLVEYVKELDKRLGDLLSLIQVGTEANGAFLFQTDGGSNGFMMRLSVDAAQELSNETIPISSGLLEQVNREDRPVKWSESGRALPRVPWYKKQPELHSLIAVPIQSRSGGPWILVVDHCEPDHFDDHREALIVSLAEQMSNWMESTRLIADLDVLSNEFRRLYEASARLSQALHREQILHQILSFCREVSRFETCAICLSEEGEESFSVPIAEGYPDKLKDGSFPLDVQTWASWILRSQDESLTVRIQLRSGMPILHGSEKVPAGVSFLGIPLRAKNRVSGALLLTRRGKEFSASDARVLRILCNQAAVAIENARVYERLEQMAATDGLTGLYNRRYFQQALEREAARVDRGRGSIALILLDIDHFKQLNDTYGHPMGDVVLRKVAETLQRILRKGDIVARYGGEEFVMLLPEARHKGAKDFAERIRKTIASESMHPGGPRKKVTVSVGWALYPEDTRNPHKLVEFADRALYFAKDTGRNKVAGYHILRSETE